MSQPIITTGEDIPLNAREDPNPPDPETRNANAGQTAKAVITDVTTHEERIPGMVKESTVWDVYNNEARKVDNELVKDWTASLNFLLVFAAIFAAVLTAFIIESKKMLEPDQTEILVDITIQYFNSMGSLSRTNLTRPEFEPTFTAISINCCLFASLGASLVAALASVVSLQWVADYDAAITRGGSSPEDRAKRRQFRHAGVLRWRMGEIIAALPLLLYSSVILFWAGAIQWMWTLHHIVGYVVGGGTAIAVLFYASTTIIGAIYVSSPFRTPLSRGLYWLFRWSVSLLGRVLLWLPIEGLLRGFTWLHRRISSLIFATVASDRGSIDSSSLSGHSVHPSLSEAIHKWIRTHLLIEDTSRHREDEAAKQDPAFQQEALAWLAEELPISNDSYKRLCLFASGMVALPLKTTLSPRFIETPWLAILEFLSARYMHKALDTSTSVEDYEGLDVLLQLIDHPSIRSEVVPGSNYEHDPRAETYWTQYPGRMDFYWTLGPMDLASMTFLLARDVPIPMRGSKYELEATFKLIRWRNSTNVLTFTYHNAIWSVIFSDIQHYSPNFFESCLRLFQKALNINYIHYSRPRAPEILHEIVKQALSRSLTIGEAVALARVFEQAIATNTLASKAVDMKIPVVDPVWYGSALAISPHGTQELHNAITLLLARAAESSSDDDRVHWAQWIVMMLWVGSPKEPNYWSCLRENMDDGTDCGAMNLWGKVDMTLGGLPTENPHIEEIMTLVAELMGPDVGEPFGEPLWINCMDHNGKRGQAIRLLDAFDKLMVSESGPQWHRTVVGLIGNEMRRAGVQWPSTMANSEPHVDFSDNLDHHLQLLVHIKDPCLASMGAFACGIQPSIELTLNKRCFIQDDDCLQNFYTLVYKKHSVNDPPALWEFRAAVVPLDTLVTRPYSGNPASDPDKLACLELLFQYPTPCHGHRTGFQHLLFHLHKYAKEPYDRVNLGLDRFDHLPFYDISRIFFDLILALLALSDAQDPSFIFLGGGEPTCSDRIRTICNTVKSQPWELFCLLVNIITDRATQPCHLADTLVILEAVEQACELPGDETTTPLLRPLASALQELLGQLTDSEALRTPSRRGTVVYETHRICGVLQARSTNNLILSTSHLRILSCARSVAVARPAIGWLGMHVDL